jgi:UDP-N-acetylglucosamine transferase subunit ALG13
MDNHQAELGDHLAAMKALVSCGFGVGGRGGGQGRHVAMDVFVHCFSDICVRIGLKTNLVSPS